MPHSGALIATIVGGIGLAFVLGTIANRLHISPLVGYLLAGVAVGPFTPGFVADQNLAHDLAEIGVILLMFGVGLHFSLKDLLAVRGVVVPGAVLQVTASALLGMGLARLLGMSGAAALVFGIALSVASTIVVMRALQERRLVETERGHIAVGWLVVQDLLMVVVLVLLPPLAAVAGRVGGSALDPGALAVSLAITLGKVVVFVALMLLVGRRAIPMLLHYVAHTGSRELFRLAVLSVALGVAFAASELFGVSFALGAFFAGMTLSESELSQAAAEESLPLRDAFAVLFFVSVGMLLDPMVLLAQPWPILGCLLLVLVGNPCIALVAVWVFGGGIEAAVLAAAGFAQIGEFSFILSDLGIGLGILPDSARHLILATAILSILFNPAVLAAPGWIAARRRRAAAPAPAAPVSSATEEALPRTDLSGHAVLVGYGRVGREVGPALRDRGWPVLVIEDAIDTVEQLRAASLPVLHGNAADDRLLAAANLAEARLLLVAIPNSFEAGQIVEQARAANPGLAIVARAHFDAEVDHLLQHGAGSVIMGEREIARAMVAHADALPAPGDPAGCRDAAAAAAAGSAQRQRP